MKAWGRTFKHLHTEKRPLWSAIHVDLEPEIPAHPLPFLTHNLREVPGSGQAWEALTEGC